MKYAAYLMLLSTLTLLFPLCALAQDRNEHSVDIPVNVQVGATQLKPGNYKLEWQGTGSTVQVSFLRQGKTIATAPATLKKNDGQVNQDDIVTDRANDNTRILREIDFAHQKEALMFRSSGM